MGKAVARNAPCPCGSGKKYKHCCLGKPPHAVRARRDLVPLIFLVLGVALAVFLGMKHGWVTGLSTGGAVFTVVMLIFVVRDPPPPNAGGSDAASINFGG